MAEFVLPTIDQFVKVPPYVPRAPAPKEAEEDEFAKLTPEQQAEARRRAAMAMKQDELAANPRSGFGEVTTAFKRGALVELPRMFGQALESTGKKGNTLYNLGRGIVEGAEAREPQYAADTNEGAHGEVVKALAGGAEMFAPSLAPLAALPLLAAGGVPAAAALGVAGAAGGALFGASQYQDTYERGIKAGLSEQDAKSAALKTGAIEGLGETVGTWIGGKFVTGAVPKLFGKKQAVGDAIKNVRNPHYMQQFAGDFAKTAAVEVGTEMGQNYGQVSVENKAGISDQDPWAAATAAIAPTLAMSLFMGPMGALGTRRQQQRLKSAADLVELKPDATAAETDTALQTLAPVMEPLVGKEEFKLYRIDRIADAKWLDEAWGQINKEEGWAQGEQAQMQAQQEALTTDLEGELGKQEQAVEDAQVDRFVNPPGLLPPTPNRILGREIPYQHYRTQEDAEQAWRAAGSKVNPRSQLDFPDLTSWQKANAAVDEFTKGAPQPAGPTADQAIGRTPSVPPYRSQAEAEQAWANAKQETTAERIERTESRRKVLDKVLKGVPSTLRDPLASVERDALPEAVHAIWLKRGGEADKTQVNSKLAAFYEQLTGKNISEVQSTKEAENESQSVRQEITGSSFEDPVSEGAAKEGQGDAEAGLSVRKEQEGVAPASAASAVSQSQAGSPLEAKPAGTAGAPNADKAAAEDMKARILAAIAKSKAARPVEVNPEGEEKEGRLVGYGEWESKAPDGTISYDTPDFKGTGQLGPRPRPKSQFELRRQGRIVEHNLEFNKTTPPNARRKARESMQFAFERNEYDPNRPRSFTDNKSWVNDFRKAFNLARGRNVEGTKVDWTADELPAAIKEKANAQDALTWLQRNYPQDYDAALYGTDTSIAPGIIYNPALPGEGNSLLAQYDRIKDTNSLMHDIAGEATERMYELYKEAYQLRVADERGVKAENVVVDAAKEVELREMAKRNPGTEFAQDQLPNYAYSDTLMQEISRGNFDRVLMKLEQNGPSDWTQELAHALRTLGLKTKIAYHPRVAYDPDGNRVYGKYQHSTGTINIYLGGENAHTVLHESVHAASVGKLAFAKAAERKANPTIAEAAAVAELKELREIIAAAGFTAKDKSRVEEEFVAEVFSNEKMQQQLHTMAIRERSLWQRFKDWVRSVFPGRGPEMSLSLEAAISRSLPFLGESRFGAAAGMEFDHSATAGMWATDGVTSGLMERITQFGAKVRSNLPHSWSAAWMKIATTAHLVEMVRRFPALSDMLPFLQKYVGADNAGMQLRQQVNSEIENVLKPLNAYLNGVKNREKVDAKMQELAGGASRLGIDLSKNFDDNKASFNKNLDPGMRQRVNELHAMFLQQPAIVRDTLQRGVLINRKHYMQHSANMLKMNTLAYAKKQPGLASTVKALLDIMNPKLVEGTNPNPKFFADAYTANLSHQIDLALKLIRDTEKGTNSALALETEAIEAIYRKSIASPYVHLGRTGEYFLEFKVAEGDAAWAAMQRALSNTGKVIDSPNSSRSVFMRFETAAELEAANNAIRGLGRGIVDPDKTRAGTLADVETLRSMHTGLAYTLRKVARNLSDQFAGDEKKEVREALINEIYSHMGDDSPSQALKRRKDGGVPGYDAEFRRSFVKRGAGASSLISNSYTMPLHDEAFSGMTGVVNDMRAPVGGPTAESIRNQAQAQAVLSSFQERFANKVNRVESPLIDKFKALGYNWFLAMSPAFMLTNMMQPYHLTLPLLGARYGFVRTVKEMGRSSAKALSLVKQAAGEGWTEGMAAGGWLGALEGAANLSVHASERLSPGEKAMLVELAKSGQLDLGLARELTSLASGTSHAMQMTMRVLATGSHYSEVVNRLTAALTAYNLDVARGGEAAQERASKAAVSAVALTQFNYSDYNTAPAFGRHGLASKFTPLLTSFQNYAFQVQELIFRLAYDSVAKSSSAEDAKVARKALAGVMATTTLLAGTLGLPLANVAARMYDMIAELIGDDDEPSDIKTAYRGWLAEVLGKEVAEAVARGLPRAALGFDMSARAGLADVFPGSRFFTDRRAFKDKMEAGAFDMLGPAMSATQEFITGAGKMSDGYLMDGLVHMTPLAVRGPLKAAKMVDKGYTTATGVPLPMEVTPWAVGVQALGFTPSVKAEASEVNFAYQQREGLLARRKQVLANHVYRAIESGEDPTTVMQEAMAFSQQHPEHAIDIAAGLLARQKRQQVATMTDSAIAAPTRHLPTLDKYSFAVTR